ncbi:MerR family transcriptional regulator [Bacillus solitudinis]|uniref:DNA-binding protein n=1 Tax=Bacillus solitudinis TaxID=2014074 RepID=UPI000C24626C|nr:DNA-binding protein [Bacillus solitudinis]
MKNQEDYPILMQAPHVAEIVGVSLRIAYEIMERKDFPLIRIGRAKRVEKEAFFNWLIEQSRLKREA